MPNDLRTAARLLLGLLLVLVAAREAAAAGEPPKAAVRQYRKALRTYPFSDPNPIAAPGRIYPYFRFDGYTNEPIEKEWTVVELENAYLKVSVLPEIGGKIWSAVEKSTGRSFIYDNHVVKFRDIGLRGPWTSGGIEANYGIIGHTPSVATPVDYQVRTDADGSATVIIGVLDLLTRTPWRLEISLPADAAYFTTRSFWYNATPVEEPYYSWMNAAIKATRGLELIYPGTHYIGHEGEVSAWPIDPANGKNLAFYAQNDFGPSKSYHVLGRHSGFFGAYWHEDDFGMGHYATRDDKLGKKAWIWALSRQGQIWERLLTDADGQYVEVQSGRLFNQAAEGSTLTPFKHRGFEPYSSDTWTEYWFPVKATKGFVEANEHGALNVALEDGRVTVRFSPLQRIDETLEVLDGDRVVHSTRLVLQPMQAWAETIATSVPRERLRVRIGALLDYRGAAEDELSRPLRSPASFDWSSLQGLYLKGKESIRQREYVEAQAALEACLEKDANYVPALVDLAMLRYRALDPQGAWDLARRALSVDTYDPAANYYYGLASLALGKAADAMDGFEAAASAPGWRVAAWNQLARLYLSRGDARAAEKYAARGLSSDPSDLEALQVAAVVHRVTGRRDRASTALEAIARLDPLSPFAAFERHLLLADEASRRAFVGGVGGELPHETFLELAAWYAGVGRPDEARRALQLAPQNAEVLYWLAFLEHRLAPGRPGASRGSGLTAPASALLQKAQAASPRFVFPFRSESAAVFEWAIAQAPSAWQPKYYLALILWSRGGTEKARALLQQCGQPDFAPFYAVRARALEPVASDLALTDLQKAASLDPHEWRFGRLIAERHLADRQYDQALEVAGRYSRQWPANYILGMLHARTQLRAGRIAEAAETLAHLEVLPYEGAIEGRALHRETQLLLAARAFKAGRVPDARRFVAAAREWPEHLGAGKPYPADADERLEDFLDAVCVRTAALASYKASNPTEARILEAWK